VYLIKKSLISSNIWVRHSASTSVQSQDFGATVDRRVIYIQRRYMVVWLLTCLFFMHCKLHRHPTTAAAAQAAQPLLLAS
jgi:hypothetical protein